MSTGVIIMLIAIVVAILIAGLALTRPWSRGEHSLRRYFGPEYERAVAQHDGNTKAAEKELREREHRHRDLQLRPLTAEAQMQYAKEWAGVQEQFVDAPAQAMDEAEQLLSRLARDRGFPADYGEQLAALSVHHPYRVDSYRQLHEAAGRSRAGQANTEELREVLVHAHGLFDELTEEHTPAASEHTTAQPERRPAPWAAMRRRDTTRGSTS